MAASGTAERVRVAGARFAERVRRFEQLEAVLDDDEPARESARFHGARRGDDYGERAAVRGWDGADARRGDSGRSEARVRGEARPRGEPPRDEARLRDERDHLAAQLRTALGKLETSARREKQLQQLLSPGPSSRRF